MGRERTRRKIGSKQSHMPRRNANHNSESNTLNSCSFTSGCPAISSDLTTLTTNNIFSHSCQLVRHKDAAYRRFCPYCEGSNWKLNGFCGEDSFLTASSFIRLSSFIGVSSFLISGPVMTGFDDTVSALFCRATILVILLSPSCDTMRWG